MDAYALMKAREAQSVAADWKAYAARVENVLRGTEANYQGMTALKDALLAELARVDPQNRLLAQENRQAVFDAAYDKFVAAGRR